MEVSLEDDDRRRVSVAEAASLAGISKRMMEYRIAQKAIRTVRDGRRSLIEMAELRRYCRTNHYDSPRKNTRAQ